MIDRIAVIVSRDGVMKLLAIEGLSPGTGEVQATAVHEELLDWNSKDQVDQRILKIKLNHVFCWSIS